MKLKCISATFGCCLNTEVKALQRHCKGIAKALLDKAEELAKTQTDEEYVYLCYWSADTPGGVYKYYLKRGYDDYKWGCPGEPIVMRKKLR